MTMTNEIRELNINELDAVIGAGAIVDAMNTAAAIGAAVSAINDIQGILGKAVDGIPPAPCHPK